MERGAEEVELVKGVAGVFEITVDGKLVFSKKQLGRRPGDVEIDALAGGCAIHLERVPILEGSGRFFYPLPVNSLLSGFIVRSRDTGRTSCLRQDNRRPG